MTPQDTVTPQDIVERLLRDNPQLHVLTDDQVATLKPFGIELKPGPANHAVPPEVIRYLAKSVKCSDRTIETGGGHTTIAFAALAQHHTCVTIDKSSVELTRNYMKEIGISAEKVTFLLESSDTALPKLPAEETFDFAFIDGSHSYPFPALDWHYIDKRLKIGGIIGFDNTEIRAVHDHCLIIEENQTHTLIETFSNPAYGLRYGANFYSKVRDDERETFKQPYNLKRAKKITLRERIKETLYPPPKFWPWD